MVREMTATEKLIAARAGLGAPVNWDDMKYALNDLLNAAISEIDSIAQDNATYGDGRPMSPDRLFKISPTGRAIVALAETIVKETERVDQ